MRVSSAAVALTACVSAFAQISLDERSVRARQVDGRTLVSLDLVNGSPIPVKAEVDLRWLAPDEEVHAQKQELLTVPPGRLNIAVPLPLTQRGNPLFDRLSYDVRPERQPYNLVKGILDFASVADFAFTLNAVSIGQPVPGRKHDVRVFAVHPSTKRPVEGVEVEIGDVKAVTGPGGVALLQVPIDEDVEHVELGVRGRLGDFHQAHTLGSIPAGRGDIQILTDKPLYQPGQTLHVRVLARNAGGKVRGGVEHELKIHDAKDDLAFAATLTTSRFGIASADWDIPPNAKSGDYTIAVESDDSGVEFKRVVPIRRYELPSFRVAAKPDKPFYLPGQKPTVEIRADYLFGKPVTAGSVRIAEVDGETVAEGRLDGGLPFTAVLEPAVITGTTPYLDYHYIAFVTDASTNRTEQRRFDVRFSREALHVYGLTQRALPRGGRLYATAFVASGQPASIPIELLRNGEVIAKARTNSLGLARLDYPSGDGQLTLRASDNAGRAVVSEVDGSVSEHDIWIDTDRALYRGGDSVECRISARQDGHAFLLAWNGHGEVVASREIVVKGGQANATLRYDRRFGDRLSVAVISSRLGHSARTVVFAGGDGFAVSATVARASYKPGESASIHFKTASDAALGVAIVDQSVFERDETDQFRRRRYFDDEPPSGPTIAGITAADLFAIADRDITDDLQLLAEALLPEPVVISQISDFEDERRQRFSSAVSRNFRNIQAALDAHFVRTLEYPRDSATLASITPITMHDPWLTPYLTRFTTEGKYDVLRFVSSGPDKKIETDDDFTGYEVRREWFALHGEIIQRALARSTDYPASPAEFERLMDEAGLRFAMLRDPWDTPLRARVDHVKQRREVAVASAGPDRRFETDDDFAVLNLAGTYFKTMESRMASSLDSGPFPRTRDDFVATLRKGGVEFDSLRDPWGHPYFVTFRSEERITGKLTFYTYAEYGQPAQMKTAQPKVRQLMRITEVRTRGRDGIEDTFDDAVVATFIRIDETPEPIEAAAPIRRPAVTVGGTGSIVGRVLDVTGAVIPNVLVNLEGTAMTRTDPQGQYAFHGLPPGLYKLKFESTGFNLYVIDRVPVRASLVTRADAELNVGSVSHSIEVASASTMTMTMSASMSTGNAAAVSTPRVREYFPETLYWRPEIVTGADGRATVDVKLADSITTWKVAVIASTVDGRIAQTTADLRVFQPFFVDLDVPPSLTIGDEIALPVPVRNYLDQAERVAVSASVPAAVTLVNTEQPPPIDPGSPANALLRMRADAATAEGRIRVVARGKSASDAIEKPVAIRPHGERMENSAAAIMSSGQSLEAEIPANAVPGSVAAEVKIYPSLLARVLETIESVLKRPYGCGEQTISSTYPNLLFLKGVKEAKVSAAVLEAKAMRNLKAGYQRLLGYQDDSGAFTYWGRGDPNVRLTEYAIRFLEDAQTVIDIDSDRLSQARTWLASRSANATAPDQGDAYAVAEATLKAIAANDHAQAKGGVGRLLSLARESGDVTSWWPKGITPFHGWGRGGEVETTGLAVSALARWQKTGRGDAAAEGAVRRGALFLLRAAEADGGWFSGQATVRAMVALLDTSASRGAFEPSTIEVLVNGSAAGRVTSSAELRGPVRLDLSRFVRTGQNRVTLRSNGSEPIEAQFNTAWYRPWDERSRPKDLRVDARYSVTDTAINAPVRCSVTVKREQFYRYGMLIVEVGLPPGVEVDRGTLARLVEDGASGVDSFEVAPDRVIFYVWPRQAELTFDFSFRPRFAMKARTAPSLVYDYYNPDARDVQPPVLFTVR